jgi:type IV pilus assembly protein PilM
MGQIPNFFGLDLGHDSFKLIDVKLKSDKGVLESIFASKVEDEIDWLNLSPKYEEHLAKVLRNAHKQSEIKTKNCVLSLPESSVFSRLVKLPKVKKEEVSESIQWALKPLIPVDLGEVNISFLEIDTVVENKQKFVNWYVVAAPKKIVEKIVNVTTNAGLKALAIETEALALSRMIDFNYKPTTDTVIVDFGARSTNVILSRNGVVMFAQTINTGAADLTKVIASDFGIDDQLAEEYKVSYGLDKSKGEGKIAKSIEPVMNIVLSEISRTLTYFRERISDKPVNKIFVTGGGASLPGLSDYIKTKLAVEVMITDPFLKIEIKSKKADNLNPNSFGVAVGLSLKTN